MAQVRLLTPPPYLLGPVEEKASNPLLGGATDAETLKLQERAFVRYHVEGLGKVQQDGVC